MITKKKKTRCQAGRDWDGGHRAGLGEPRGGGPHAQACPWPSDEVFPASAWNLAPLPLHTWCLTTTFRGPEIRPGELGAGKATKGLGSQPPREAPGQGGEAGEGSGFEVQQAWTATPFLDLRFLIPSQSQLAVLFGEVA